jgi:hypothetical protein
MPSTYRGMYFGLVMTEMTSMRKFKTPRTSIIRVISRFWTTDLITELGQSAVVLAYVHLNLDLWIHLRMSHGYHQNERESCPLLGRRAHGWRHIHESSKTF